MILAATKENWFTVDAGNYDVGARAMIGSKHSWEAYKMYCESSYQTRNGAIAHGVVEPLELNDEYARPEFVSEHQGRVAFLLGMILMWNPYLAKREKWATMLMYAMMHDVGEIELGDQLDDGATSHVESKKTEAKVMSKLFSHMPKEYQPLMKRFYTEFERYEGDEMAIVKAVDKAEAILWQLFLKTKGREGDVRKKSKISSQDMRLAGMLGSFRPIDVWTLHYRLATKWINPDVTRPVTRILEMAFIGVYRNLPKCMTMDIDEIEL